VARLPLLAVASKTPRSPKRAVVTALPSFTAMGVGVESRLGGSTVLQPAYDGG
jgi:hypothetical protein